MPDFRKFEELMMFQQSNSRNQRTKGSKIRTLVKVSVLLGVSIWLIYQIKQSHDKKAEFASTYDEKLSNGDGNEYLGRKGKAGSENVVIIETQDINVDESSETNESGGGEAGRDNWAAEEKNEPEAVNKEIDEHQDVFSDTSEKEGQQEKQENEDENADSRNNGDHEAKDKVESEEKESQEGTISDNNGSQQEQLGNENVIADTQINEIDQGADKGATEEKGEVLQLPSQRESDGSFDQSENTKELEDNGAKSDNNEAIVSTEENISSDTNQGKIDENAAHDSESGDTISDSTNSGAVGSTDSSLPDDKSNTEESANTEVQENEAVESMASNNPVKDSQTDLRSGDELVNPSLSSEQNIAASRDNEALEKDINEHERDNIVETEITENHNTETTDSDTRSAEEIANPSNENASGDSSSEEVNTSNQSDSSEGAKLDDSKVEEMESEGNGASAENTDNSAAEIKTETSEGIVDSSQVDKQSDLQVSADKVLDGEAVESRGGTASAGENASGDARHDAVKTESNSNSETSTELVDNVDVSGSDASAEEVH